MEAAKVRAQLNVKTELIEAELVKCLPLLDARVNVCGHRIAALEQDIEDIKQTLKAALLLHNSN
ncbi:hypothetical protein PTSG_03643 [Salpingoeca rosetta]|uniref:Uncharacterized protein n=1 Tax=Salpingoeca rosetta (strain ATCC 50818 / BSB-021) TaxID=946362 RepID=F2U666_SALR5|nr:uncharacterized protein PTSG_03643 [Salpingoeca rosetta]EGD83007.1 hypothetical protein PTSG_03643 [Salpingoeca rosetta]|eukprot:XP_004995371.1 hypothetical protein PTSG_03643 [Salpingoeca rosetta]